MGVKVDKEYQTRRARGQNDGEPKRHVKSLRAKKMPMAHVLRNGGVKYAKNLKGRMLQKGASREVMMKITGSANHPRGVKNSINYIAREGELIIRDSEGSIYSIGDAEQRKEAYDFLLDEEDVDNYNQERSPNLVHNMMFSPPIIAGVSEEDMLKAVEETLKGKYPDNRYMMAYHKDTEEHPHVHVLLRIPDDNGNRINICKKDLRELREGFSANLQKMGYNVKATHKYKMGLKDELNREPDRLRGLYEVVKFGRTNYQFDPKNKPQNFITIRTLKNKKELTRWGTNLADEITREKVKEGSVIKLSKEGQTTVKVPKVNAKGERIGWMDTKRNNWRIENQGALGIKPPNFGKVKVLDTPDQLLKQQKGFSLFNKNKEDVVKLKQQQNLGIKIGIFKF